MSSAFFLMFTTHITCSMHLSPNKMTYDEASNFCQNHCGSTLSVNPEPGGEETFALLLAQYSFNMDIGDTDIWTGFHYDTTNNDWRWPDGSTYGSFTPTQTNDYCGKLVITTNSVTMTETLCSERHRFFCEHCNSVISKYIILRADIGVTNTWDDAQTYCNTQYGTSLISIHSLSDFNAAKLLANFDTGRSTWFGLRGPKPNFDYDQSDGTEWDYGTVITPLPAEFPWANNQPDGNGLDECGTLWYSRQYQWDDENCAEIKNFLCFIPSELCNHHGFWQYINGNGGNLQYNECELQGISNTITNEYTYAILNNIQYINNNGPVIIELTFSIQNEYNNDHNIGIMFDVKSQFNYWFAGIEFNYNSGVVLTIYHRINNIKSSSYTLSISSSKLTLLFNTYYILIATLSNSDISVTLNGLASGDILTVSNTYQFAVLTDGISGLKYSGFIGIAIHNVQFTAKMLYVSGTSINISPFTETPTNMPSVTPTKSPSKYPTETTIQPSNSPTKFPSQFPSKSPSKNPSKFPSKSPSKFPSKNPSKNPSEIPTQFPTKFPTNMPTVSPIISDEGVVNDMKTTFKSGLNDDFSNDDTMSIFSLQYIIFAVVILCLICIVIALAIKISKNNKNKKKAKIENKLRETQGVIRCTSDSMQTTENTMRNIEMHTFETTETH
eukprot:31222_1